MDVEDATENELSEAEEDELTDSQQTNRLSELYSTTVPSVDSAMDSWDGSGLDAGYGSQGRLEPGPNGGSAAPLQLPLRPCRDLQPPGGRAGPPPPRMAQRQAAAQQHAPCWPPEELPFQ